MLWTLNAVELEFLLSQNVVVSEWHCVGMALCGNGDMSGFVLSEFES